MTITLYDYDAIKHMVGLIRNQVSMSSAWQAMAEIADSPEKKTKYESFAIEHHEKADEIQEEIEKYLADLLPEEEYEY
jgi:hypothetical protein